MHTSDDRGGSHAAPGRNRFLFSACAALHAADLPKSLAQDKLIALVPAESVVIAGIRSPAEPGRPGSMLLVTLADRIDLQDFLAIVGTDPSRAVHEAILLAATGPSGPLSEHGLLANGHFDGNAITRFALESEATRVSYRGLPVLAMPAFAREQDRFKETRWLALLDDQVVVFGSPSLVQRVLDRQVEHRTPDAAILSRIDQVAQDSDAWCLAPMTSQRSKITGVFDRLDARLGAAAQAGEEIQYGIRMGRQVEITLTSDTVAETEPAGLSPIFSILSGVALFVPSHTAADSDAPVVVHVPLHRYERWIAEYSNGGIQTDH